MPFSDEVKTKVLLWSDRHCCLCKKVCGPNIEVHHIVPESENKDNTIDNAIPLCFDCHGIVGSYNTKHPKGNRFKPAELIARRDQVYEEFTRHLVPPIFYKLIGHESFIFPHVGFRITHIGKSLPIKVKTMIGIVNQGSIDYCIGGHYSGEKLWHLNPGFTINGHFYIPEKYIDNEKVILTINAIIIDQYERCHEHLPIQYIYDKNEGWFVEP